MKLSLSLWKIPVFVREKWIKKWIKKRMKNKKTAGGVFQWVKKVGLILHWKSLAFGLVLAVKSFLFLHSLESLESIMAPHLENLESSHRELYTPHIGDKVRWLKGGNHHVDCQENSKRKRCVRRVLLSNSGVSKSLWYLNCHLHVQVNLHCMSWIWGILVLSCWWETIERMDIETVLDSTLRCSLVILAESRQVFGVNPLSSTGTMISRPFKSKERCPIKWLPFDWITWRLASSKIRIITWRSWWFMNNFILQRLSWSTDLTGTVKTLRSRRVHFVSISQTTRVILEVFKEITTKLVFEFKLLFSMQLWFLLAIKSSFAFFTSWEWQPLTKWPVIPQEA